MLFRSTELKALNSVSSSYWLKYRRMNANTALESALDQTYRTVMSGFAHNPHWTSFHAKIWIGPFFTHLVWSQRPSDAVLCARVEDVQLSKEKIKQISKRPDDYPDEVQKLLRFISYYRTRVLPDRVLYSQMPVFTCAPIPSGDSKFPTQVSLSPEFLYSLAQPIVHSEHIPSGLSSPLFPVPPNAPPQQDLVRRMIPRLRGLIFSYDAAASRRRSRCWRFAAAP